MKKRAIQAFLLASMAQFLGYQQGYAQSCSVLTTDISTNNQVCNLYGDANGNSNWNWEAAGTDPNFCNQWYARFAATPTVQTPIGSPFVNSSTGKLASISQSQDYTKAKGWELLRRDFGCQQVTSYPYFVLYNRYSGLMRVYIYQNGSQLFSSMAVKVQPVSSPYPATTAIGDPVEAAPDKYLTTTGSSTIGSQVLAVSDNPGGASRWTVVEFNPGFDPNIGNAVYKGANLAFTVYGVQNYALQATINGTSVPTSGAGLNVSPATPLPNTGSTTFTAAGEKFNAFGKDLNDLKSSVNSVARGISGYLGSADPKSTEGKVKASADTAQSQTQNTSSSINEFATIFGDVGLVATGGGSVLKLVGDVLGLLTGGSSGKTPAPAPSYTSNFSLKGSLTLNDVAQTFVLRVPGTQFLDGNNATYYRCPMGIFNIAVTPRADTIIYTRTIVNGPDQQQVPFVAYHIRNDDIPVTWFDGTGLDLVSVQAAIVGKVQPASPTRGSYDPLAPDFQTLHQSGNTDIAVNYLRPDFEAGRLEISFYDTSSAHLHVFQTPYYNLECIKGLTMNVPKTTTVSLRIKAVLKRKDDPANTPILFVEDYQMDYVAPDPGTMTAAYRTSLMNPLQSQIVNPPYANYSQRPSWTSDRTIQNTTYSSTTTVEADNSITANTNVVVGASAQNVVFEAGSAVYLEPGFTTTTGCSFTAFVDNFGFVPPTCGTLVRQPFASPGNCYDAGAAALSHKATGLSGSGNAFGIADSLVNVYPVPADESVTITGLQGWGRSLISVIDQSGRTLYTVAKEDESPSFLLNVERLSTGVYFLRVQGEKGTAVKKIFVSR
jgi:hypothetical protein